MMEAAVLESVGKAAGIGGIALGVFLLLFRELIRKNIFPQLPPPEAYRLLRLIAGAVWSIALVGILAWVYVSQSSAKKADASTEGSKSPIVQTGPGGTSNVKIQ